MQFLDSKELRIKELENENRKLQEKVTMLEHDVELLTQAVLHASKQRFGASSEKTPQIEGQYSFLDEIIDPIIDEAKVINIKEHKRPVRKKRRQRKID
nr:transposase [Clostridium manihotivorum]